MNPSISEEIASSSFIYLHSSRIVITKNLLIFKTDINTSNKVKIITPLFNNLSCIVDWSVDIEDIDNVLRIETSDNYDENEVIKMIKNHGVICEILND